MNTGHPRSIDGTPPPAHRIGSLADFSTDRRVLLLCLLALLIGAIGAVVAKALLWLIALITNVAYFLRWSSAAVTSATNHLGWWAIIVPVIGAMLIGLMARYGSENIRGYGIPEALEAILLGRSLIDPKAANLKPESSPVSIGTGGPFGAEGPIIMTGGAFGSIFAQFFHLIAAERKTLLVALAAADVVVAYPDETLQEAIAKMLKRNIGRLPIVGRADPGKVIGYPGRADILAARIRLNEEEELRERGPLLTAAGPKGVR